MGLCPSRQNQKSAKMLESKPILKTVQKEATPKPAQQKSKAHKWADAEPFVPPGLEKHDSPKQAWELYLDAKTNRQESSRFMKRGADGMYTSQYRRLLGGEGQQSTQSKKYPQETLDFVKAYRDKPREFERGTKRKQTPLKKSILAGRAANPLEKTFEEFDAALRRLDMRAANDPKALAGLEAGAQRSKDDAGLRQPMPYFLTDRSYWSDSEEGGTVLQKAASASQHSSRTHAPIRGYVTQEITPEVECALSALLFRLRQLRDQELGLGLASKRYSVGFREAARLITSGNCKGVVFAPDLDRTQTGELEAKMAKLIADCKSKDIPTFFGLSRRQLGKAIQKNVAISVLAIEDVRGALCEFKTLRGAVVDKPEAIQ